MYQSFQSQQNGLFRLYRTFELTRSKKCPFILKQHCWICTSSSWRLSFFSSYSRISWTADSHHCPSEDMSFLLAILLTFSTKTSGLIFGKPLSKGQPSTRLFIGVGGTWPSSSISASSGHCCELLWYWLQSSSRYRSSMFPLWYNFLSLSFRKSVIMGNTFLRDANVLPCIKAFTSGYGLLIGWRSRLGFLAFSSASLIYEKRKCRYQLVKWEKSFIFHLKKRFFLI